MQMQQFIDRSHLDLPTLNAWIEAEWLVPIAPKLDFSDAELARVRLIQDYFHTADLAEPRRRKTGWW